MGVNDPALSAEQAVRLLRAKAAESEHWFAEHADDSKVDEEVKYLRADIALLATLLADQIERVLPYVDALQPPEA